MSAERALVARLLAELSDSAAGGALGAGDDAAVVAVEGTPVAITVDVVVEGVHWNPAVSSPGDVGWKAIAVNVSDLAAVGADPVAAVVGLQRPCGLVDADVEAVYAGMAQACDRWGLAVVGGDVVDADGLGLSVTAMGAMGGRRPVTRAGARPGDRLVCVGSVGAAAAAMAVWAAGDEPAEALGWAHRRPQALPAAGRALAEAGATAMIDLSDGLGVDAAHLCRASKVAARVQADQLPIAPGALDAARAAGADPWEVVAGGGEDFALLAAVPAEDAAGAARRGGEAAGVPAEVVGELVEAHQQAARVALATDDGARRDITDLGHQHGGDT